MSASIGVMGDVMLGRAVAESLARSSPRDVWAPEVRDLAASVDVVVANVECCLSVRGQRTGAIPGKPFFFRGPPGAGADALVAMRVRVAGLANNHVLDYGEDAAADTLDSLAARGIAVVGAGRGPEAAARPAVVEANAVRVGVIAVSDHPAQYAARPGRLGIAYARLRDGAPRWLLDGLRELRARCDAAIAFVHWGPNMTERPQRWQRERAGELQAAGADLVAGHSAHVFHGVGWTGGGPVLYDLGDALDDYAVDARLRNDLGVLAVWRPGASAERALELVGLRLDFCHTRLAAGADADWIAARLTRACRELGTEVERTGEQRFLVHPREG